MTMRISMILVFCLATTLSACQEASSTSNSSSLAESQPTSQTSANAEVETKIEPKSDPMALGRVLRVAVKNGKVDYELLRKNKQGLDSYIAFVKSTKIDNFPTKKSKIAFYTNAYNAYVLAMVRDRPSLVSVEKEKGFFDQLKVEVAKEKLTLNQLEGKARALGDPRVHFIVNCASGSCPILENKPFYVDDVQSRMKAATARYLADPVHGMKIDSQKKVVYLSNIFNWYAKDFAKSGKPKDVLAWISNQVDPTTKRKLAAGNFQVKWLNYDWSLNKK